MKLSQGHKVVFIGNSSVGKTSIISQIMYNNSSESQQPTVGVDYFSKNITVGTDTIRLQIWDTAGQEQFHSLIPSYLRNSTIAIIVYDISNQESFQSLDRWIKNVQDVANPALIIVGNKTDLDEIRTVSTEDGETFAQTQNAKFIETSARKPSNIDKLVDLIGQVPVTNQSVNQIEKNEVKINETESSTSSGFFISEATSIPSYRTFIINGIPYNRRRNFQFSNDDLTFRLDISIDKPIDDISDVSANLTHIKNGIKNTIRIPYYGISFKDQRFFILFGTFSKDDEVDYKWARMFFRNYTARLSPSNGKKNKKLFFNHQKIIPLFYKEYPNSHIAFRIVTISFTTHQIDIFNKGFFTFNNTLNQKQSHRKSKKDSQTELFYNYLSKTNFNPYNIPCFAQGILGEGYDIKMKISGVEYDSLRFSIEVRFYLTLVGFCLILSFYAWNSLRNFSSTQAHISSISFLTIIFICAYDISVCLDFSSTSSMNDCFMPPSRLYLFIFFAQMALYFILQFPIVLNVFKQQEIIQNQNILQTLIEIISFIIICYLTHLLHVKTLSSKTNNKNLSQADFLTLLFQKIYKKRLFLLLIALSQFTPQIIKNLRYSQRGGVNMQFIILIGLNRFILFIYSDIYPYNIYESETIEKNFNSYLATNLNHNGFYYYFFKLKNISYPSLIILLQVLFLFFQEKLGPYFFIPKLITPRIYNYRSLLPQEGDICLICQDVIIPSEEETAVTPCGHAFHLNCLARWMEEKQECPTCRTPIPPINKEDYLPLNYRNKNINNAQSHMPSNEFHGEMDAPFDLQGNPPTDNIDNFRNDHLFV